MNPQQPYSVSHRFVRILIAASMFLSFLGTSALAQAYVIKKDGTRFNGVNLTTTSKGVTLIARGGAKKEFIKGGFLKAWKPKPAALAKAELAMYNGQGAQAAPVLAKIMEENKFLPWEQRAARLLVRYYIDAGQPESAEKIVTKYMAVHGTEGRSNPYMMGAKIDALVAANKLTNAESDIGRIEDSSNRDMAAYAQMRLGDVQMKRGLYENAVMEFLRTVHEYSDANPEVVAEAFYRAGTALAARKDAPRANNMYKRAFDGFPGTIYGSLARGKIR